MINMIESYYSMPWWLEMITNIIFLPILHVICVGFVWKYKNTWQIPWTKVSNSQELFSSRTVESQAVYGGDGSHEMTIQLMPRTCHYWLEILIKIINYLCHMMNILPHSPLGTKGSFPVI